jgi:rhomboid protease GluP
MVRVEMPHSRPIVTYAILGVTLFVFLLQELNRMGILQEPLLALTRLVFGAENLPAILRNGWGNDLLVLLGGKINDLIVEGQVWRLLTPALLHAGMVHVGANMYSLFVLGRSIEQFYGHWRFLALYVLAALGGNVLSFLLSDGISVGASTAIFGLIGAQGVFAFQNRGVFGSQARNMLNNTIFLIMLNLFIGFSSQVIDNWGHLGGLALGLLFAWFAGPRLALIYNYPKYGLEDQRAPVTVMTVAVVLFLLLAGVVFFVIQAA